MDYIKTNISQMNQDSENIKSNLSDLLQQINRLEEAMSLLSTAWEGKSWVEFQKQVAIDINELKEINGLYMKVADTLSNAGNVYKNAELDIIDEILEIDENW